MEVYARLLGAPQLKLANSSYDAPPTKATILLYYLAYKGEWCSRDELLYLFYPDTAEEAARSSLRQLLTSIRRLPYSEGLEIEAARRYTDAAKLLEKLYKADPLDEAVLQRCVMVLYGSGERHKALVMCEAFTRKLRQELDGEPEEATLQLVERIKKPSLR